MVKKNPIYVIDQILEDRISPLSLCYIGAHRFQVAT